jgi:hypothetical protein
MANLPLQQPASQQDTRWKSLLDPLLVNLLLQGQLLSKVPLTTGANVVNHGLGRQLQGYIIVLNSASVTFYDEQSTNASTNLTLVLVASAPTTVSIWVF